MSDGQEVLSRFAKVLVARDRLSGGFENGAWGAAIVAWAATIRRDHAECGKLDRSGIEAFGRGEGSAPYVVCPVHGKLSAPEMPK